MVALLARERVVFAGASAGASIVLASSADGDSDVDSPPGSADVDSLVVPIAVDGVVRSPDASRSLFRPDGCADVASTGPGGSEVSVDESSVDPSP